MTEDNRYHYWLYAQDPTTGKPYLIYGCPASDGEERARIRGLELLPGIDFEIKRLRTMNLQKASSMIRGKRLESSHSLRDAGQRIGHERSLRRINRRRRF